ncbi:MAG: hypothetical protein HY328_16945 [Chloroflexi bacterium]|nr:hypothetical protein [Chloroflexota bacterium]
MQTQFIHALTDAATADPRIRAAWLAGSFGKGIADRWSDVDAHLLIDPAQIDDFHAGVRGWLEALVPLVLYRLLFGGEMVNAMTDAGLRLDVWLHSGESAEVVEGQTRVLYAAEGALAWKPNPGSVLSQAEAAAELERAIPEFWRCIAMLPVALGRDEKLIGAAGNFLILLLLTDVLSVQSGIRKDRGVKALNGFLPPTLRRLAEDATALPALTRENLAHFQLRLAGIMQEHGPAICARWRVDYPQALEDAALRYVAAELRQMGFGATLEELYRPF